jgi:hypothetical protein
MTTTTAVAMGAVRVVQRQWVHVNSAQILVTVFIQALAKYRNWVNSHIRIRFTIVDIAMHRNLRSIWQFTC